MALNLIPMLNIKRVGDLKLRKGCNVSIHNQDKPMIGIILKPNQRRNDVWLVAIQGPYEKRMWIEGKNLKIITYDT